MRENSRRVLAIGKLPPPIGGATVFFERWIERERQRGRTIEAIDIDDRVGLLRARLSRYDEIVLNSIQPLAVMLVRALFPATRITVIDHNASRRMLSAPGLRRRLFWQAIQLVDQVAVVSRRLAAPYAERGIDATIIDTALPPDPSTREREMASYSPDLRALLDHPPRPLLAMAVYLAADLGEGDVYGIHSAFDFIEHLREKMPGATLLLFVAKWGDDQLARSVRARVKELERSGAVFIEEGPKSFWPVVETADLVIRLTSTDGDSVTIREALWARCPVLASDSVERPVGCLTYRYGDEDDLLRQAISALKPAADTNDESVK